MDRETEKLWRSFAKHVLVSNDAKLRNASRFKVARPWLERTAVPSQPTRMLSNVMVYHGWQNPTNIALAKEIVSRSPQTTLRELLFEMLRKTALDETSMPYVWWIWLDGHRKRAIHEDSDGLPFVKIENKWHLTYPLQAFGALVGAQGAHGYEDLPNNAYFIPWENESDAKKYY